MFHSLLLDKEIEFWSRYSGLAEHPVEAGVITSYTSFLALTNVMDSKTLTRRLFWGAALAIGLYSVKFSQSFTGMFSFLAATAVFLAIRRSWTQLISVFVVSALFVMIVASTDILGGSFLQDRIENLLIDRENYETVGTRYSQISDAIAIMVEKPASFLFGFGYSERDLDVLQSLDIHNGLLAAWFHFGILGLAAQVWLIFFVFSSILLDKTAQIRSVSVGILIIFGAAYMTGPAFFRRSMWIPPLLSAALIRDNFVKNRRPAGRSKTQPQIERELGGALVRSDAIRNALPNVQRPSGNDRFA
jgi:hypothetical protein